MTAPDSPLHWVEGLDEAFFRLGRHTDTFVTLNTGLIDIEHGRRWWFVSAGHPWPVLLHSGVEVVEPHVGPPLGIGLVAAWKQTEREFPADAVLMLYTDGLIENAGAADGEQRLIRHLSEAGLDVDELLRTFGPEGFDDDVAVLTITLDPRSRA
jgi:serine phosphatase RsbU (regulator of sigma subunit)